MDNISELLSKQCVEVNKFFDEFNPLMIEITVNIFMNCEGDIYFCGLGKNETIINHLIAVLKSISIKTNYLSPTNCLHGDIGVINTNDIIFFVSKSGNTIELLNLIPYIKKRTDHIYSISCNENSKIGGKCKDNIILPCGIELGNQFNLIPTTSVLSFMIFCNILVISLVGKRKVLLTEYGNNHPLGSIGRKITLIAEDIMITGNQLPLIYNDTMLFDALLMMTSKSLGLVLIVNEDTDNIILLGIITDGDIRRYVMDNLHIDLKQKHVQDIMNTQPITFNQTDKLEYILTTIRKNKSLLSGIPIINDTNNLCGLITHNELF
jgi:arabinose-5-phosphate isomerase